MEARRTTTPRAVRRARRTTTASATATGSSRSAATASSRASIPRTPTSSTRSTRTASLVRFDRRSGEQIDIQPQPEPGEPGSRWNWDSPLIVSPHLHTRIYYASQRLWRSDDRGDSWKPVSPDLTRQLDRNRLPVMGRVWSPDAVGKNTSTCFYGNIVALDESPRSGRTACVGTDDGLVQVSGDGGGAWRRSESFPGVGPYATFRACCSRGTPRTRCTWPSIATRWVTSSPT